jgi:nucleotide-binding universal stress UspA family protein
MHALAEAFKLSRCEQCWITVAAVVPPYEGDLGMTAFGNVARSLRQPYERAIAAAQKMASEQKVLVKTVLEFGEPFERIADLAEGENCDVIIMGRSGRRSLQHSVIGSVTSRVIGYSQRDVLVIPPNSALAWRSLLIATDKSRFSRIAERKAIEFSRAYQAVLHALVAVDLPDELYGDAVDLVERLVNQAKQYLDQMKITDEAHGVTIVPAVREGVAAEVLLDYARAQQIDLIVLGSHGRSGLHRLLMGSVTESVIRSSPLPVLVVKT